MIIHGWLLIWAIADCLPFALALSAADKSSLRNEAKNMFFHAFNSYMTNAYPADELKPLSCTGRYRGRDASRGDVDDAMGNFAMTLIDSLDTLPLLGEISEFSKAVRRVIDDVSLDNDVVVSVFESNIRVLGGLLGAHVLAVSLKEKGEDVLSWYDGELLNMAKDLGDRLAPAFNTPTGIPYARVNLKYGMSEALRATTTTCTACGGTMLLEFGALSRLTGDPKYERMARKGMDAIWQRRSPHLLVGTTIDVNSGDWREQDSGVGAGIDSYYEYCLKAYVLFGSAEYLDRFKKHYAAVMQYVRHGNTLLDVHMFTPQNVAQHYVDSLAAFWPGLQVLAGDIDAAIELYAEMERVVLQHKFLPEAYNVGGSAVWTHHFLRPEFVESTYFLYQATKDEHYLDVGKMILTNLQQYARVNCGFAAFSDLRTFTHEDRMDSFVLAETFKYLYLLFADNEDIPVDLDDYVFSTEAHLLPISLALAESQPVEALSNADFMLNGTCSRPYVEKQLSLYAQLQLRYSRPAPEMSQLNASPPQCGIPWRQVPLRISPEMLNIQNEEHTRLLKEMGITILVQSGQQIQLMHNAKEAETPMASQEGLAFMQALIEYNNRAQSSTVEGFQLTVLEPSHLQQTIVVGGAHFGPDIGEISNSELTGELVETDPQTACQPLTSDLPSQIAFIRRGSCMFIDKVMHAEAAGAIGAIVYDLEGKEGARLVSMTGNGSKTAIPAGFMLHKQALPLLEAVREGDVVTVTFGDSENVVDDGASDPSGPRSDSSNSQETVSNTEAEEHTDDHSSRSPENESEDHTTSSAPAFSSSPSSVP